MTTVRIGDGAMTDGADTVIRTSTARGISREVAVVDIDGFQDRDSNQRHGKVACLNGKAFTIDCNSHPRRVSNTLLHRMIDADADMLRTLRSPASSRR